MKNAIRVIATFFKKHGKCILHKVWYLILLVVGAVYIWNNYNIIIKITEFNIQLVIFLLWLLLLISPLFSELEIGSIKLKKEVKMLEENQKEIKEDVHELKMQIIETKLYNMNNNDNSVVTNIQILRDSLPSKDNLSKWEKSINADDTKLKNDSDKFEVSNDAIYLFKVRATIENIIDKICVDFQYPKDKSMMKTVIALGEMKIIPANIVNVIVQIVKITNKGIHGENVDPEYMNFIKNTYSVVLQKLNEIHRKIKEQFSGSQICVCPRCYYVGPSEYSNKCPKCGFISCDD